MAIARVQHTLATGTGTSLAKAYASNVTAGSLLVCTVYIQNSSTATATVADSLNGSYTNAVGPITSGSRSVYIYYFPNSASGANTVTATLSASVQTAIGIHEFSGAATSTPLGNTSSNTGSGTAIDPGSIASVLTGDLVFGVCSTNGGEPSAGTGFTKENSLTFTNYGADEDQLIPSDGSYDPSFTSSSGAWSAAGAWFKQAAAAVTRPGAAVSRIPIFGHRMVLGG